MFVSSVSSNSLAWQAGLKVGDQLLEVCGINLRTANYYLAAQVHNGGCLDPTILALFIFLLMYDRIIKTNFMQGINIHTYMLMYIHTSGFLVYFHTNSFPKNSRIKLLNFCWLLQHWFLINIFINF